MWLRNSLTLPIWPDRPFRSDWDAGQRGLWAERVVARYLWRRGWQIRHHRWLGADGSDIDLIAANHALLLFAEVKFRPADDPSPWQEVLDVRRQGNLRSVIGDYLMNTRQRAVTIRVDAFVVHESGSSSVEVMEGYIRPEAISAWRGVPAPVSANPAIPP